jgi:hypothetical protein
MTALHDHERSQTAPHRGLLMTDEESITKICGGRWSRYARAGQITQRLKDLLLHVKTHRMPNLLIVGQTNKGNTALLTRFLAQRRRFYQAILGEGVYTVPVIEDGGNFVIRGRPASVGRRIKIARDRRGSARAGGSKAAATACP